MQLFSPKYEVEECIEGIRKVLESGWSGCGPACREFEKEWSSYLGAKDSHYMSSATAALHVALRLSDLAPNSPVLTTALTFVSTNAAILYEGHTPIFVDINEKDFSIDASDFLKKMDQHKAKASMWVHYGGNVSPHFYEAKEKTPPSFRMIEDCAHAAGAKYSDGTKVGSREDTIACFSYHSVKNLPTFDSGMLCCSSKELMARARKLSWLGIDKDTYSRTSQNPTERYKWHYDIPELGWKYNGNDIAATIGLVQLKYLSEQNAYRTQIFEWYKQALSGCPSVRLMTHESGSAHHLMVIRVSNRSEVMLALQNNGIAPGVHYLPNNEFPIFQKYYAPGDCPVLERVSKELITLPNHLFLTKNDIEKVCEVVVATAKS